MSNPSLSPQPSLVPTRKVASVGIGGAVTTLLLAIMSRVWGIELTGVEAGALTTCVGFLLGYMITDREV